MLAAAVAAGVADRLITYTYHRAPSTIALGDVTLPAQFSRAAGADGHLRLGPRRFEPARRRRVQALIGACDRGPATIPTYYTRGYTDAFPHGAVLLNGLTGELGRGFYRHLRPEATPDDLWRSHIPPTPVNRAALEELCHWWRLHPQPLDRRERFYWEARLASWASVDSWQLTALTQEQGLTYLSPLNCLTAFREILSLPEASRHRGQHVRALIEALCPALNAVLYNPPDPLPRRLARDLRRAYAYGMRRLQRCRQWVC